MTGIRLLKMYQMKKMKMHYDKFIQVKEIYNILFYARIDSVFLRI